MPFQFSISNPYHFERNKGVGCGSLYYGLAFQAKFQPLTPFPPLKPYNLIFGMPLGSQNAIM
jgi:hypothetical protein